MPPQHLAQRRGKGLRCDLDLYFLPELPQQVGIGQRPVARLRLQSVAADQRVETVLRVLRIQFARQLDGAQDVIVQRQPGGLQRSFQEPAVKARVVRDQQSAIEPRRQRLR